MWCVSLPRRRSCWVLTLCSYCFCVSRYCSLWRFGTGLGGARIPGRWDQCFSPVFAYLRPGWCTHWSMWWLWTVLLVVVFDRCQLFGGCESVSLWYPEQQPQFTGWVTPMGYYEDDHASLSDDRRRNIDTIHPLTQPNTTTISHLKVKISKLP